MCHVEDDILVLVDGRVSRGANRSAILDVMVLAFVLAAILVIIFGIVPLEQAREKSVTAAP